MKSYSFSMSMFALMMLLAFGTATLTAQSEMSREGYRAMGTNFTIIIYGDEGIHEANVVAFQEVLRINKIFSTYDPDSEVSRLNRTPKWVSVSDELIEVIRYSEKLNKNSMGAFDIKIGETTKLWKSAIENDEPPAHSKIDLQKKKKHKIKIRKNKVKTNLATQLDFGAIAKGYAVDKAYEKLLEMGYDTILVDGGGDIRLGESPFHGKGWKIGLHHEGGKILWLKNCAIATSGQDYQNVEIDGEPRSHIIDPKSREGLTGDIGVTVISDSCMQADALATAFSVLGSADELNQKYHFQVNIKQNGHWIVKQF